MAKRSPNPDVVLSGGIPVFATREMTATPKDFTPEYDWRKEPWLADDNVRDLSYTIAIHVMTALAMDAPGEDEPSPMEVEDEEVFALLNPSITERVWRSGAADDEVRARTLAAAAQGIDAIISQWMKVVGSVDGKQNPPTRKD